MKKTLRKVIVVKRFITFVGLFCLLIVCLTGQAQIKEKNWNRIPENQKTAFLVSGPDNQVMYIQCFISTLENWRLLLEEQWEEGKESTTGVQSLLEALFPGQTILFVWVTNGPRAQSFSPTNFVFTQGKQQYEVSLSDIYPLDKQFVGGEVEPYAVVKGFIAIPEGIDLTKPFMIRYGEAFGVIAQAQQGPGTTTPVQPPTRPGVPTGPIRVPGDYPTISAALQAAPQGAEIRISRGSYRGDLLVTRPVALIGEEGAVIQGNLTIQGAQNVTLNTVEIRGRVEIRNSADVTISRVHVSGSPSIGVLIEDSTATISECQIEGSAEVGVDISFGGRVILHDCEIAGSGGDGVRVGFGTQARIVNTTIRDSSGDGLEITGATVELLGNRFVDNRSYGIHAHSGATLLGERNRGQGNELGLVSEEVPIEVASIRVPQEMSLEEAIQKAGQTPILLAPGEYEPEGWGRIWIHNEVHIQGGGDDPGACVIKDLEARGNRWTFTNLTLESSRIEAAEVLFANCHVKDVRIGGDTYAELKNSLISNLTVNDAAQVTITDSRVSDSRTSGITVGGSAEISLTNTAVSGNGAHGLYVTDEARVSLENSTITGNKWTGLEVKGEAKVSLVDCTVEGNGTAEKSEYRFGIAAGDQSQLTLQHCTLADNGSHGLYAADESRVTITGGKISGNGEHGVLAGDMSQVELQTTTVSANGGNGILVERASQIKLRGSEVSDNQNSGLVVGGEAQLSAINLIVINNGADGILADGLSSLVLQDVFISGNAGAGVLTSCSPQVILSDAEVANNGSGFLVTNGPAEKGRPRVELRGEVSVHDNRDYGIYVRDPEDQVVGGPVTMWGNGIPLRGFVSASIRRPLVPQTQRTELSVPGDYPTIQEAIDAIAPGGTITLAEGTFREGFTIWKSVTIRGAGPKSTTLTVPIEVPAVAVVLGEAHDVKLADLKITECRGVGLAVLGQVELVNLLIARNRSGISAYGDAQVILRNSQVFGHTSGGVRLDDLAQLTLRSSQVFSNWGAGLWLVGGQLIIAEDCWISDNECGIWMSKGRQIQIKGRNNWVKYNFVDFYSCTPPEGFLRETPPQPLLLEVKVGPAGNFSELSEAIAAAAPGATVRLQPGNYFDSVIIAKDLTLVGSGCDRTVISQMLIGARGVVEIRDLTVGGQVWRAFEPQIKIGGEAQVTLCHIQIIGNRYQGLMVVDSAHAALEDCIVSGNGYYGIVVGDKAQVSVSDSIISYNEMSGLYVLGQAQITLEGSIIESNGIGDYTNLADLSGIAVLGKARLTVRNSVIRDNVGWGVFAYLEKCGLSYNDFRSYNDFYAFSGEVILQNNEIYGNGMGDVCLPDLCIPEDACK